MIPIWRAIVLSDGAPHWKLGDARRASDHTLHISKSLTSRRVASDQYFRVYVLDSAPVFCCAEGLGLFGLFSDILQICSGAPGRK
jgi:hypothetical protein